MPIDHTTPAGSLAAASSPASPAAAASGNPVLATTSATSSTSATSANPAAPSQSAGEAQHAGYVPGFAGADGQEDPAPEAVVSSIALPHAAQPASEHGMPASGATPGAQQAGQANESSSDADDGRFQIAEEVSTDLQTDAARRIGQLPQAVDSPAATAAGIPDPQAAVTATVAGKNAQ